MATAKTESSAAGAEWPLWEVFVQEGDEGAPHEHAGSLHAPDVGSFFDPAADKVYRHPQFYKVPRGVKVF